MKPMMLLAYLVLNSVVQQDDLPTAESVIDDHIRAIGREMTLASIETVKMDLYLEGTAGRGSGPVAFLSKGDKWIYLFNTPSEPNIKKRGFDGNELWESIGSDVSAKSRKWQVKCHEIGPSITKPLTWREYDGDILMVGRETVRGKTCFQLEFRPNGGDPVIRYFDEVTMMLVKVAYQYDATTRGEQHFADFRKVKGIMIPFEREQTYLRDGNLIEEFSYTMRKEQVIIDQFIDDDLFEKRAVTDADWGMVDRDR